MGITDLFRRPAPLAEATILETPGLVDTIDLLQERLAELELGQDDIGWLRIDDQYDREFSREGLRRIIKLSRYSYLRNPLINRSVDVQRMYVWGQGVSISAASDLVNEVVQAFLDDPKNMVSISGHQARGLNEVELATTGNVVFALFPNALTGAVRVRTIPVEEIDDVILNPEDSHDPWYYRRVWRQQVLTSDGQMESKQFTAYYPDWRHRREDGEGEGDSIGQHPIKWDVPIYHVKVGGFSDMRFGLPETYAALDWARAYKDFLEDWHTLVKALSRLAWKMTVKGGASGVARAKTRLATTVGTGSAETNPPPVVGSTMIASEDVDITPISKAGTTTSADDARRSLLMVASAMGLPETFYGDASVGTVATATSLDRPTELKFNDRRTLWAEVLNDILQYVIDRSVAAPHGILKGTATLTPGGDEIIQLAPDGQTGEPMNRHLDIDFPSIIDGDASQQVTAIVTAATLDGKSSAGLWDAKTTAKMLLSALGEDDIDELLATLYPDDTEGAAPGEDPKPDGFTEAVREMREALKGLVA